MCSDSAIERFEARELSPMKVLIFLIGMVDVSTFSS